jgi:hypothetical protein
MGRISLHKKIIVNYIIKKERDIKKYLKIIHIILGYVSNPEKL